MKLEYNRPRIFTRAAELYRETVNRFPEAANRATRSACLRAAWSEDPAAARRQWHQLSGEDQRRICIAALWTRKRRLEAMDPPSPAASVIMTAADAEELSGEVWIGIETRTAEYARTDKPGTLYMTAARAANKCIIDVYRYERQHPRAELEDMDRRNVKPAGAGNPEAGYLIREELREALDRMSPAAREVFQASAAGYTAAEIAAARNTSVLTVYAQIRDGKAAARGTGAKPKRPGARQEAANA